jgi:hypothetical protein
MDNQHERMNNSALLTKDFIIVGKKIKEKKCSKFTWRKT